MRLAAPEITVSITALEASPDLKRAPYDLNLFFRPEGEGSAVARDEIFPVCAPALAARLTRPEDLSDVPCLTDTTWAEDWDIWASTVLPDRGFAPKGPVFSLYALAVEEAVNGAGVLMGHAPLVQAHLDAGTLVAPFPQRVTTGLALTLWSVRRPVKGSAAAVLSDWLTAG